MLNSKEAAGLAAGALAFVGDAVFTLFVRSELIKKHDFKTGELTRRAARIVSAVSQSKIIVELKEELLTDELEIVKRCRNAHCSNIAKNATASEYHNATGLEGLLGYLYLTCGERLDWILKRCLEIYEK